MTVLIAGGLIVMAFTMGRLIQWVKDARSAMGSSWNERKSRF